MAAQVWERPCSVLMGYHLIWAYQFRNQETKPFVSCEPEHMARGHGSRQAALPVRTGMTAGAQSYSMNATGDGLTADQPIPSQHPTVQLSLPFYVTRRKH